MESKPGYLLESFLVYWKLRKWILSLKMWQITILNFVSLSEKLQDSDLAHFWRVRTLSEIKPPLYGYLLSNFRFISARLLSVKSINPSEYINELDTFLLDISIVSLIACLWVMFVFINSKKWNQMPHLVTMGLAFAQVCGCIGKDF